jgi:hypothetical protein
MAALTQIKIRREPPAAAKAVARVMRPPRKLTLRREAKFDSPLLFIAASLPAQPPESGLKPPESTRHTRRVESAATHSKQTKAVISTRHNCAGFARANFASLATTPIPQPASQFVSLTSKETRHALPARSSKSFPRIHQAI